jgi:transposase
MANASPRYTPEFKARAVEMYRAAGPEATYAEIARDLGVDAGSLSHWVKLASNDRPDDPEMNPFQIQEENRRLKRELARLREENEILLKASAFFASKQL